MAKSKALAGVAKDAYLKRTVGAEPGLTEAARARLTARLQEEIALVSLRHGAQAPGSRQPAALTLQSDEKSVAAHDGGRADSLIPDSAEAALAAALALATTAAKASSVTSTTAPALAVAAPSAPRAAREAEPPCDDASTFDPFEPNVIVVIRRRGRAAALTALEQITSVDNLRLLAREQQLGLTSDLAGIREVRQAIIAAAERRIANRRAAAS